MIGGAVSAQKRSAGRAENDAPQPQNSSRQHNHKAAVALTDGSAIMASQPSSLLPLLKYVKISCDDV